MAVKFILKRRDVHSMHFGAKRGLRFGKWVTVSKHDTFAQAADSTRGDVGLVEWVVFRGGRRVSETVCGRLFELKFEARTI